jgi:hypothetical protein
MPTQVVVLRPDGISTDELARLLRDGTPAIFTRVQDGAVRLDPRTLLDADEEAEVVAAIRSIFA